jgi:hypothetical protein
MTADELAAETAAAEARRAALLDDPGPMRHYEGCAWICGHAQVTPEREPPPLPGTARRRR